METRLPFKCAEVRDHVIIFRNGPAISSLIGELKSAGVTSVIIDLVEREICPENATMIRFASLLLCLILASCVTPASQTTRVEVVDQKPAGSIQLGRVSGDAEGAGVALHGVTYKKALESAMSQAGSLGATHLVIDKWYRKPRFWGSDQSVKGSAYRLGQR